MKRSITKDDIDLRKKRACKPGSKKIAKSLYTSSDWTDKFSNTDFYVEALEYLKECVAFDRQREALRERLELPYEKMQALPPVARAKREEAVRAGHQRFDMKAKELAKKRDKLDDKLLDHRIATAKVNQRADKMRKGAGGVALAAGKIVAEQAKHFAGEAGQSAVSGTRHGAYLAHQAMAHKPEASKAPTPPKVPKATKVTKSEYDRVKRLAKADNQDVDADAGRYGVADYGGQVAMRVQPNAKCNGCLHYDQNQSVCVIGLVPAVCGDGSYPEIGFAPAPGNRIASQTWTQLHADAVAMPAQAENHPVIQDIPYRIEVLGDSALSLSEKMTLLKSYTSSKSCGHSKTVSYGEKRVCELPKGHEGKHGLYVNKKKGSMGIRWKGGTKSSHAHKSFGEDDIEVIEVLGDSALSLSEKMTLLKSLKAKGGKLKSLKAKGGKKKGGYKYTAPPKGYKPSKSARALAGVAGGGKKQQAHIAHLWDQLSGKTFGKSFGEDDIEVIEAEIGVKLLPPPRITTAKSHMTIDEFADLVGTTSEVVHSIATKLGSKEDFAKFIKGKLPDIMMAHGLDEAAVGQLYRAAVRMVKGLSDSQWSAWKGFTFSEQVGDEELATAIDRNGGLLDANALHRGVVHASPREVVQHLPAPEPIQMPSQDPIPLTDFVGGNLHLADSLSRLN